jgi:integrase/recombinase XerD
MKETDLYTRLDAYLALREALGLSTRACRKLLQDFVTYLKEHDDGKPIRSELAVDWACSTSAKCGVSGQAARLGMARGFLTHLKATLPETEIPGKHLLATPRRPQPYIFSSAEISRVLKEAAQMGPRGSLRPFTYQTLLGLLASTGLRPSEAAKLLISDVHLDEQLPRLLIRQTKFQKSRWVPLHHTAAVQLRQYAQLRREMNYDALSDSFFVSEQGRQMDLYKLRYAFRCFVSRLGLESRPGQRHPTLHSFRHTFAVNRLRQWYEIGADVHALLPNLSVYLGHVNLSASFWYLSATPELLCAAAQLFEINDSEGEIK